MKKIFDTVLGQLVLKEKPQGLEFGTPLELLELIEKLFSVQLPKDKAWDFVILGAQTPSIDDAGKLWIRTDANRNPLGLYLYVNDQWRLVTFGPYNRVEWFYGDAVQTLPGGYKLADGNVPGVPDLKNKFIGTAPNYTFYAAVWVGY